MNTKLIHIGIDVDDNSFTGAALNSLTGEVVEFKSKSSGKALEKKLSKLQEQFPSFHLKICYEATYLGFSLQRELTNMGYHCDVIAPSSIPRKNGNKIKTDRIDAGKLAQFYASNMLTIVQPPDPETEKDRDLLRTREFVMHEISKVRSHIQSLFRRNGFHFKKETNFKSHWTQSHLEWIESKIKLLTGSLKLNIELLLQQHNWLQYTLKKYNEIIDQLAESEKYKKEIKALTSYKGIQNIWALVILTEIGNIKRFAHPNGLVAFMGLDIREYSSGGKENKFGITKTGNRFLRNAFSEINQKSWRGHKESKTLRSRRKGVDQIFIDVAKKCTERLHKKGSRLYHAGKHVNKIKIACAREMIGFVWESLTLAAELA